MFSVEKYDQFTFGRTVHVQSDHKPLESILKKPLHRAPKRLQSMMLHLQRYDILVVVVVCHDQVRRQVSQGFRCRGS